MKYSIITINFNNRDGLEKTIRSVIDQTCQDFEYIIIDGGSSDGSVDVINKYANRIDYWVSEPDNGIYNAMNKGILQARGDYLNFMNSGDCFYDENVLKNVLVNELDKDMIIGRDYHYNETNGDSFSSILPIQSTSLYLYIATYPHQSTFFKKELFNDMLYDEKLRIVSDWKFFVQQIVLENCSIKFYGGIICRREPDGICGKAPEIMYEERGLVLSELFPIGIRRDYDKLCLLQKDVFDKLIYLCTYPFYRNLIRYAIKIVYKLSILFK